MPGTMRGALYSMDITDALAILLAEDAVLAGDDELHRAAQAVVDAHALDVIRRYAPKTAPSFKVVRE